MCRTKFSLVQHLDLFGATSVLNVEVNECFYMKYFRFDYGTLKMARDMFFAYVRRLLMESRRKRRLTEAGLKILVKQRFRRKKHLVSKEMKHFL